MRKKAITINGMNTLSRIIKRRSSSCGFGSSMIPVEDDDDEARVDDIG